MHLIRKALILFQLNLISFTLQANYDLEKAHEKDLPFDQVNLDLIDEVEFDLNGGMSIMGLFVDGEHLFRFTPVLSEYSHGPIVGPVNKTYNPFRPFRYWRFVTYYNLYSKEERVVDLPRIAEECLDSDRFASYQHTYRVEASVETSLNIADLGIRARLTLSNTLSITRNLKGQSGESAIHTPYIKSKVLIGRTFIQAVDKKTNTVKLYSIGKDSDSIKVDYQDPILYVKRDEVQSCH
ncbi:MAG: hypothetical protein H6622_05475 [Halobacteriovoraceae bacterium]|nr:hypothetical protein [Halobacteriovoraceae bacterium]